MEVTISKLGAKKVKVNKFFTSCLGVAMVLFAAANLDANNAIALIDALNKLQ